MKLVGIDIGGTKCTILLGTVEENENPTIIGKTMVATKEYPDPYRMIEKLQQELERLLETHSTGIETIASIGISCGGPLDSVMGIILSPLNLPGWDKIPIVKLFEDKYGIPTAIQNNANACALAEWKFGAGRGPRNMNLGNLFCLSNAQTRSISPENFIGEKGKGGMASLKDKDNPNVANASNAAPDLGQGWKVNPYVKIKPGETFTMAEIDGSGAIQHIWMTPTGNWRYSILRIYWDGETEPSVECPVGDFFCMGWNKYAHVNSLAVCVNPGSAFNCYWSMPFRKKCRITMENINDKDPMTLYYQVDYTLTDVPVDAAYFHAQYRRQNPVENSVYTIADNIKGKGQFVGVYLAWGVNNNGWWGEGEIKFYINGDSKFPTICGTGTEDYFCGSYDFDTHVKNSANEDETEYTEFCTPYTGLNQVIRGDGHYNVMQRFGLYRWHIMDPIRFEKDLKITIQDLGWHKDGRYLAQHSDISSVCFWYQTDPHTKYPKLPDWQGLEIN